MARHDNHACRHQSLLMTMTQSLKMTTNNTQVMANDEDTVTEDDNNMANDEDTITEDDNDSYDDNVTITS